MVGTNQTRAANQSLLKNHPFDAAKDFTAVSGLAEVPHVLVVRKHLAFNNLAVKNVAALVALAKQKPGGLNCGSTGVGSALHLTMELFKTRADVAMLHVPFRGSAPLITEPLAARIDVSFATLGMTPAVKSPAELAAMIPAEVEKWAAVIKPANVIPE